MGKVTSFTPEEIRILEAKPSDLLREKIEATGSEEALAAFDQLAGMFKACHDNLGVWITYVMDGLYKQSPDALDKAMYDYLKPIWSKMTEGYWDLPFKDRVVMCVNGAKMSHNVGVIIDGEDDQKLTFHMNPCGSGQCLYESGIYDGPNGLAKCSPHRMTGGMDNFPVYCVHAPLGDICAIESGGAPNWVMDYADPVASCACKYIVYKRKEDIPEEYYTRVGMKKPEYK